ncbi:MAG: polyphosphate kinase 1 [Deltaproteobacteria bacterium]|nr:polyphosphate kinase 1 [Deltaproteobacteria bacterium]
MKNSFPTVNRELSWLDFNARVLQEANDPTNPLYERIRFLGIFSSNLSEFYRVRVATLKKSPEFAHLSKEILKKIKEKVVALREISLETFFSIKEELKKHKIRLCIDDEINQNQKNKIKKLYAAHILANLNVYSLRYLKNIADDHLYLLACVSLAKNKKDYWLVEIPKTNILPRFVIYPEKDKSNNHTVFFLDDIIKIILPDFFKVRPEDLQVHSIRFLRDADFEIEQDNMHSVFDSLKRTLEKRTNGSIVRVSYDHSISRAVLTGIMAKLGISFLDCIPSWRYQGFDDFVRFPKILPDREYRKGFGPVVHPLCNWPHKTKLPQIARDILLHFPYNSFDRFLELLHIAAIDPHVESIKISLYRLARDSKVIQYLILAARNGKKVEAAIEFSARFDEEANLNFANQLEQEKIKIYPKISLKVHSKICLITYATKGGAQKKHVACIGTGNFNEDTSKIYSDHLLITSNTAVTEEVKNVFRMIRNPFQKPDFKNLVVSPHDVREVWKNKLRREVQNHKKGLPTRIILKLNSLSDAKMIQMLYQTAKKGVRIELIVRGICCLVSTAPVCNNNIKTCSLVDRYLEHSRVFYFENGGDPEIFIGSADWMERNLDRRIEVVTKINDIRIKNELISFLNGQLKDNTKMRITSGDLTNRYKAKKIRDYNFQSDFYNRLGEIQKQYGNQKQGHY